MEYWVLWFIGIIITIGTRIAITYYLSQKPDTYNNNKVVRTIIISLVIICIVIVGGILVAKFIGNFANIDLSSFTMFENVSGFVSVGILTIIGAILTYIVGYFVLGLYMFDEQKKLQGLFKVVFILSIIGWSIPICHYNRNIETLTQDVIESKQERQLMYFCNIPVQEISGKISGSSFLGSGNVSGEITTSDNLPYWYLDQNGDGVFDSASAKTSKIVFIDDNQSPYVEIVVHSTQNITKNHNNGREKAETYKTWTEYTFYLPKTIMQYDLR